ncbi:hypothetical protein C8F01DRAFT_1226705 [Mycena amicta]|nr:hypothetical protein C8F01DRAFT_1226705 [Mycena amicta]
MTNHDSLLPSHRSLLEILPLELWDGLLPFIEDLLELAKVSIVLNELCIRCHAAREGFTLPELLRGHVTLLPSALRALAIYAPSMTLPAEKLVVDLSPAGSQIQPPLQNLHQLVLRAPHLRQIKISFENSYKPRHHLHVEAMSLLCSTLSHAAGRNSGPVVVFSQNTAFTCRAADIADWDLPRSRFNPPPERKRRRFLNPFKSKVEEHTLWRTMTTCHDGQLACVPVIKTLCSVHLSLEDHDGSLLVYNASKMRHFSTPRAMHPPVTGMPLFNVFLRQADLPLLQHVYIHTLPDPAALRQFLVNHPRITLISYCGKQLSPSPAVSPPLIHHGITEIHTYAQNGAIINGLVPGLHLSPNVQTFKFFIASTLSPAYTKAFLDDLRYLAGRPSSLSRVTLDLVLSQHERRSHFPWKHRTHPQHCPWAQSAEALEISASLHCVRSVSINADSFVAESMLSWLVALPAADNIVFWLPITGGGKRSASLVAHCAEFRVKAQLALSNVHISVGVF